MPFKNLSKLFIASLIVSVIVQIVPISYASPDQQEADIPQLPLCTPGNTDEICELQVDWDITKLDSQEDSLYSLGEDNSIFFTYKGDYQFVFILGDVSTQLTQLPGTDWFVLAARIPRLDEAVLNIQYVPVRSGNVVSEGYQQFAIRGENSPEAPERVETLTGEFIETQIESDLFDFPRDVFVYLPPEYDEDETYPVLYATDGQALEGFARVVEPQILNETLQPIVMVGLSPIRSLDAADDSRAAEYLPGYEDSDRFDKHAEFFTLELIPWAEENYSVSTDPEERIVFGLSNGAAFSAWAGINYPDIFGNAMVFSFGYEFEIYQEQVQVLDTEFYLTAGTLEPAFYEETLNFGLNLGREDITYLFKERVAGHNFFLWQEEFVGGIIWLLDTKSE